jgi:hypothetical protein
MISPEMAEQVARIIVTECGQSKACEILAKLAEVKGNQSYEESIPLIVEKVCSLTTE